MVENRFLENELKNNHNFYFWPKVPKSPIYPDRLSFIKITRISEIKNLILGVPRMNALFFHRLSILERVTDHKCINDCSYSKKEIWVGSNVTAL